MKKISIKHFHLLIIGVVSFFLIFSLHFFGAFSAIESKMYDLRFKIRGPLIGWDSNFSRSKISEDFVDLNKNGIWDNDEEYIDIGNQTWNTNEVYQDVNNNGIWDLNEPFEDKGNNFRDSGQDVILIEIDDESYRLIPEGYPYTRGRVWSSIVRNLTLAGAKTIVFDIMFDSPDHTTQILENTINSDCKDCSYIDADIEFSNAISYAKSNNTDVILSAKVAYNPNRIPAYYFVEPYSVLLESTPPIGLIDQESDLVDNVTRRYPIFYKLPTDSKIYLSLAVQSVLSYKRMYDYKIKQDLDKGIFQVGDFNIPTYGNEASFLLNYLGPTSSSFQTFDKFSLSNVLDTYQYDLSNVEEDDDWMDKYINKKNPLYKFFGDKNPFKNKIVIIGSSLPEDNDFVSTPYFNYHNSEYPMPGLEVHANAIQQLLDSNFIHVPSSTLSLTKDSFLSHCLMIILFIFLTILLSNVKSMGISILLTTLSIIGWFSFSIGIFINDHLWMFKYVINLFSNIDIQYNYPVSNESILLPVFFPIASIILTFGINLSYKFLNEQKDKKFLKETFGKYVSPKLIDDMYKNKKLPELGGESGIRTAFFSDLQAFSTISEQLTSKELVDLLNEFLSSQTEIILSHKGTLDKYEGDAILAFFGAPVYFKDHPKAALDTAVYCQKNLSKLNKKWQSEGDKWPEIVHSMKMRIGINSGEMVTGNMGSKHHMNYTMMGDVVNIAARLESAAKQYGILFHTTEDTLLDAGLENYCWRYIDRVQFVGKTVWHQTVEIIDFKDSASSNNTKLVDFFNKGMELFYQQKWDEAIEIFYKSAELEQNSEEEDINPSRIFIERAYEFKRFPPRRGWRGAFVLEHK